MDKCIEYLELISAYIDGELTEYDRKRVDEHLETCENCSAILDLYREVSVSAEESCVPAPEALRVGVMDKILSGETDSAAGAASVKRQKTVRTLLTRYLPIAACLAVVLLTLPWIMDNQSRQTGLDNISPAAAPEMSMAAPSSPDAEQDLMIEAKDRFGGNATAGGGGGGSQMPESPLGGADMPMNDPAPAPAAEPAPAPAPAAAPGNAPAPGGVPTPSTSDPHASMSDADTGEHEQVTDDNSVPLLELEFWRIFGDFDDAYAWIEIIGDLPELLTAYVPEPQGDSPDLAAYYMVPRSVAQMLIDEIKARDGFDVPVINEDSDYAIVLFTRND